MAALTLPTGKTTLLGYAHAMAISVRWLLAAALVSASFTLNAEPSRLPAEEMAKAIKSDSITIPTPGELFAALAKPAKIDWPSQYRQSVPMTYQNRAQIALNLGRPHCRWFHRGRGTRLSTGQEHRSGHSQIGEGTRHQPKHSWARQQH